ncbi:DUF4245 domain-containing protein [Salinifilum aidingensis]
MRVVAQSRNQQPNSGQQRTMTGMVMAVLALALVVGGVTALMGRCSFTPGGPEVDGSAAPSVNAARELDEAEERVDFPLAHPRVPDGWQANSANVTTLPSHDEVVRVGWVTGARHYLRLAQSAAAEEEFVAAETRQQRPRARGTAEVGGQRWVIYDSIRDERAWITERGGAHLLITGDGQRSEFRELARAALRDAG